MKGKENEMYEMTLRDAKRILNIQEVTLDNIQEIKTTYKKLMHTYHPDLHSKEPDKINTYTKICAEINSAYEVVNKEIDRLKVIKAEREKREELIRKNVRDIVIISLSQLEDIYDNKDITVYNQGRALTINKRNKSAYKIVVRVAGNIEISGIEDAIKASTAEASTAETSTTEMNKAIEFNEFVFWNSDDIYIIEHSIPVHNSESTYKLKIGIGNKESSVILSSEKASITLVYHFRYNITLNLRITKRIE